MTLPVSLIAATCLLSGAIAGCSTDKLSKSNDKVSALAGEPPTTDAISHIVDNGKNSADLQSLKAQLELQQQQLEIIAAERNILFRLLYVIRIAGCPVRSAQKNIFFWMPSFGRFYLF